MLIRWHPFFVTDKPSVREELTGQFHRIYRITGTRMFLINRYVGQYSAQGKFEGILADFSTLFFKSAIN